MVERLRSQGGFGLIELLIAMVVMQVGLIAVVGAFGAGSVALATASHVNTGAVLADQQMELYRAMPYNAIGLDTASAPASGNYVADTTVCISGGTNTCSNTPPLDNDGAGTWSCTASSGSTSVSLYFSANGVNPCTPERAVTSAASPDGHPYTVETYIRFISTVSDQRETKQASVVVRDGRTGKELAKEVTTFDCSTGTPTNSTC